MAWIRSQDKTKLLKANYVRKIGSSIEVVHNDGDCTLIGKYSTEEKALEVLDMIQKYIGGKTKYYITKDLNDDYHVLDDMNIPMRYCKNGIFEMPADEKV